MSVVFSELGLMYECYIGQMLFLLTSFFLFLEDRRCLVEGAEICKTTKELAIRKKNGTFSNHDWIKLNKIHLRKNNTSLFLPYCSHSRETLIIVTLYNYIYNFCINIHKQQIILTRPYILLMLFLEI